MLMNEGLDEGDILRQEALPFAPDETTASATPKLAQLGAELLLHYLDAFDPEHPERRRQDSAVACYAPALDKREAPLDWQQSATRLACKIRAFNPHPVATAQSDGEVLRLWHAHALPQSASAPAGTVISTGRDGLMVACGEGRLCVIELQRPGGRRMSAQDFCNARNLDGAQLC